MVAVVIWGVKEVCNSMTLSIEKSSAKWQDGGFLGIFNGQVSGNPENTISLEEGRQARPVNSSTDMDVVGR